MSAFSKLYNGETTVDFVGRKRIWFLASGAVILLGVISLFTRELNLGIEFEGGVSWQVPVGEASVDGMRDAVEEAGLEGATVQEVSSASGDVLRIKAELGEDDDPGDVTDRIAEEAGVDVDEVTQQAVSRSWGDEITSKAQRALIVFLVAITIYITLRFEWKMALATLAALIHDILVTVGVYSIFQFEVTPATVIAILTILGYSIYDGIVVFDRVDENAKELTQTASTSYSQMVNDSLNQVLMRTLNTSITALLPILSLLVLGSLVLGATTLQNFALALFVGLASGAYSSIFIASPVLALLKEREELWQQVAARAGMRQRRAEPSPVRAPAVDAATVDTATVDSEPSPAPRPRPPAPSTPIQPRGRKRRRR